MTSGEPLLRCRLCGHVHRGRMGTGTANVKRVVDRWAGERERLRRLEIRGRAKKED